MEPVFIENVKFKGEVMGVCVVKIIFIELPSVTCPSTVVAVEIVIPLKTKPLASLLTLGVGSFTS
jgi:hypothetical protein